MKNNKIKLKIDDCLNVLKDIPSESIDLVLLDPPYNIDIMDWDNFEDYIEWAKLWISETYRVLKSNGNCVIFGGTQFGNKKNGDLIELIYYIRHYTKFRMVNTIIWYYKNGISAKRFFANRHEEIIWITKNKNYYFNLDSVRIPYDNKTKSLYLKDKRLNPENIEKGKNPTNVWEIGRLNANSKERVGHPTQKPKELIRRLIKSLSPENGLVLDFFAGSCVSGIVALEENRFSILCDNDPATLNYFRKQLKNINLKYEDYV
ncbi:site-specific DNA-methyltransferase [Staphylococcus haemolyticus]|uniref:DNA-methyltransferase n=1 Tax=Staphylococcus TaxID=1279 RepID=UPI000D1F291B|nr:MULTISPECIES: site-specific DNA-methyltransferase [Staphylococcus]PTK20780.1 site-specific DNA-methyltransferase [Staphylococcus hominis]PTK98015.1 site-specific DNA-methyltransferase [Staphylococcus haemolyticus]RIO48501.1 site-specific DNA-methyltransferase [Staphylococcus hominis]